MKVMVRRSAIGVVQWTAMALAVVSAVWALAWALGPNGVDVIELWRLGDVLMWSDANTLGPNEAVTIDGEAGVQSAIAAQQLAGGLQSTSNGDFGVEFYGNESHVTIYGASRVEQFAWMAVRALPLAGVAVIWWLVFRTVGEIRRAAGFGPAASRRIIAIGVLVAVGSPLAAWARWAVADWIVEGSAAGAVATAAPLAVNLSVVVAGLVIMALGVAWREAAAMRRDLEGLV
ncbi:hypothetical protein [Demequina gelatinilytica]|uniref:hypothetical protein n=1 Tax=Demequina gelatinilytica TaxID=1638980 RepID=UPI0007859A28|nr:hypothetical protein [Demequina gelatinilytica]